MKRASIAPPFEMPELRQAAETVRRHVAEPRERGEGRERPVDRSEYERLKADLQKTKAELEKVRAREAELFDTVADMQTRTAAKKERTAGTDWKRAIVLSEIIGPPRGRRK